MNTKGRDCRSVRGLRRIHDVEQYSPVLPQIPPPALILVPVDMSFAKSELRPGQ